MNIEKPLLWERTFEKFWDDEHISKQMLMAHINPTIDAASRNATTIDSSVKWLASIIKPGSCILDLGCGPGLYTKPLSDLGYNVVGVDLSARSLKYAKSKDKKTKYYNYNYLDLNIVDGDFKKESYDAILLIYCDYAALVEEEKKILLSNVYKLLKPNGIFIFDVFSLVYKNNFKEEITFDIFDSGFWCPTPHCVIDSSYFYGNVYVNQYFVCDYNKKTTKRYLIWDKFYSTDEIEKELKESKFIINNMFGDITGKPYTIDSETIALCCKKE